MAKNRNAVPATPEGLGVDYRGNPVIDPTRNVLDLVAASVLRLDDLRTADSRHLKEITEVRFAYESQLRQKESERIDAIRAVDVGAVNRAAEVSAQQATALASQVATSAEALRVQVEATRAQTAASLAAALEPIQKDIQELRKTQYEQQGQKQASADPQLLAIQALQAAQSQSIGANAHAIETRSVGQFNLTSALTSIGLLISLAVIVLLLATGK
jgi:hypothetical protein